MGRRPGAFAALLAAAAVGLAACGSTGGLASVSTDPGGTNNPHQAPAAELSSAVTNLGAGTALTLTASAVAPARLLDRYGLKVLAGARLSVELVAPKGKTVGDLNAANGSSASVDLTLRAGTTTYVELRSIDQMLYLRVDVKDLLAAVGDSARYDALVAKADALSDFAKALVGGKWVSLPLASLSMLPLQRSIGFNPLAALHGLLTDGGHVTRTATGSTDRLVLREQVSAFAAELRVLMHSFAPHRPARLPRLHGIAHRSVTLDAAVREGALSSLTVNLDQLAPHARVAWPLTVTFARSGPAVIKPSGAVAPDLPGLLGLANLFGQGGGNGMSGLLGGLTSS
ncbi:MAG TPA: hypothetical protein VME70_10385 [Mycobacteriales bacterium]|nr:hypothetical protein [Mycobacteriales bacterium]